MRPPGMTPELERKIAVALRLPDGPQVVRLSELLLSDQTRGAEGIVRPLPYQVEFMGAILKQRYPAIDGLFPTGCGKTYAVGMAAALRLYFWDDFAPIICPWDKQTRFIRNVIHNFYKTGHPLFREALLDSPKNEVRIRNIFGRESVVECHTANIQNEGDTLLGIQGATVLYLDERALLPDIIFNEKVARITAPQGRQRLIVGITTTQSANHTYEVVEAEKLPRRETCDPSKPHITARGGAVYKATWRDGVAAGRFTQDFIDERRKGLGEDVFNQWYECEFPMRGDQMAFPPDLVRQMLQ